MVSHGEIWHNSCAARGMTDLAIGSSDWLGLKRGLVSFWGTAAIENAMYHDFVGRLSIVHGVGKSFGDQSMITENDAMNPTE